MTSEGWIKVRSKLKDDGRLLIASRKCNATSVTMLGALVTLWAFADDHADEHGVLYGWTADDVDKRCGIEGFARALPTDWIDLTGEWVKLPEYQEHNGSTAKSRAMAARRMKRHRSYAKSVTASVTPSSLILSNSSSSTSTGSSTDLEETATLPVRDYQVEANEIGMPAVLNTMEARRALAEFMAYRDEKGKPWIPVSIDKALRKMAKDGWDARRFCAAVEYSIAQGFDGIYEEKQAGKASGEKKAKTVAEQNILDHIERYGSL